MTRTAGAELTREELRQAYGMFPSGVAAVCASVDSQPIGLAVSSFTSVSMDPPLVSICLAHSSTTWPVLRQAPRLGVSILGADHGDFARQLSAKDVDRFQGVTHETSGTALFINGATMWADCSIENEYRAGDHDIVVLRVHSVTTYPTVRPIVFHASRFHELRSYS